MNSKDFRMAYLQAEAMMSFYATFQLKYIGKLFFMEGPHRATETPLQTKFLPMGQGLQAAVLVDRLVS